MSIRPQAISASWTHKCILVTSRGACAALERDEAGGWARGQGTLARRWPRQLDTGNLCEEGSDSKHGESEVG